jgi:phenylacetate-CoA oxygenase PaaH subunit
MDTQWPRYEVFEQERPGQPYRNAGSVHAPDPEMALQNARDVFGRRPECSSLWVVPESRIYAWTAESLETDTDLEVDSAVLMLTPAPFEVFQKQSQRQAETFVTHVGQVSARTPAEALRKAMAQFDTGAVYVWWVVPARAILSTQPGDVDSFFGPARDKPYRQPNYYRVFTQMRAAAAGSVEGPAA